MSFESTEEPVRIPFDYSTHVSYKCNNNVLRAKTLKSRWLRYWRDPKDKGYMKELPPDDFEMNTVTTVNPYIYLDEIEQAEKQKEYQEKVEMAQRRREMQAKAIKKREKVFIKEVNTKSAPGWYQDLSVRQGKRSRSKVRSDPCCQMYRSHNLNVLYKHDEERKERRRVIMGNLERLA